MTPPSPADPRPAQRPPRRLPGISRILMTLAVLAIATAVVGSVVIALRFIQLG